MMVKYQRLGGEVYKCGPSRPSPQLVSWKRNYSYPKMVFSAKLVLVLVAAFFTQGLCASHVRRSTDSSTPLDELVSNARAQLEKVSDEMSKLTGVNPEELKTLLETKSQELQTRMQNVMEEMKKQVETHGAELPDKTKAVLNEVANHLNSTVQHMKEQAPGTMDELSALQQRFTDSFKASAETMVAETGKLARAAGEEAGTFHDEMTNFSRNAMTQTLDLLTQFGNEVKAAVTRASS